MKRLLALLLLGAFAFSNIGHAAVHGLEAHPDDCQVAVLQRATPAVVAQPAPALAAPVFTHAPAAPLIAETFVSFDPFYTPSRGPPPLS